MGQRQSNKERTMSVLAELSLFPMDKGESVGRYVAAALEIIRSSGVPYELHPMGTCLEGEWDEVMAVVKACHDRLRQDSDRVYMTVKIDSRAGDSGRLRQKVETVRSYLTG